MFDLNDTGAAAAGRAAQSHQRFVMITVAALTGTSWLAMWLIFGAFDDMNLGSGSFYLSFAVVGALLAAAWFAVGYSYTGSQLVARRVAMHAAWAVGAWFLIAFGLLILMLGVAGFVMSAGHFGLGPAFGVIALLTFVAGPIGAFYLTFKSAGAIATLCISEARSRAEDSGVSQPEQPRVPGARLDSVDALRGSVMILMALDHVRDFIHRDALAGEQPTILFTTTLPVFMTRWVTHVCAPVFMFTAGIGAYFYLRNGRTRAQLSQFLVTRGLWLIVLELTVMRFAYNFNLGQSYPWLLLILWILGLCMIALAALVWLPLRVLAGVSVATIVLQPLVAGAISSEPPTGPSWQLLFQAGFFPAGGTFVATPYPLVPWFAVMALGFCCGEILEWPGHERRRVMWRLGVGMSAAFVLLRALNVYGDPSPWETQFNPVMTVLSFLNTSKYPPSLLFLLMTLGPALIALSVFDRTTFRRTNPLIVFGRVPLFYFVLHFVAAHLASFALAVLTYGTAAFSFMLQPVPSMGTDPVAFPQDFGWPLWVAYAVWIAIVAGLYPLCRWFAAVKERRRDWWLLSYL